MAGPVTQSGAHVACPGCGADVLQKEMIPVGVLDGVVSYLCVACARKLLKVGPSAPPGSDAPEADEQQPA